VNAVLRSIDFSGGGIVLNHETPTAWLLGPVDPSFRALSGRLKLTVRRHKFNTDSFSWQNASGGVNAVLRSIDFTGRESFDFQRFSTIFRGFPQVILAKSAM